MVKEDFPALRHCVYLDNAATTQKPRQVIKAIVRYYEEANANVHRSVHELARRATEAYEDARERVAKFIGARTEEVVFVKNTTEALNLAAHILAPLCKGRNIVTTVAEHHSNLLPWRRLDCEVRLAPVREDGTLDEEGLIALIDEETAVVTLHLASNVTGYMPDMGKIVRAAHKVGALVVADGAQYVPHVPVDVRELGVHMLAFSGHKMLGPMGIGVLWMERRLLEGEPLLVGGGMIKEVHEEGVLWADGPHRFEAGTPNVEGAVGLAAAIDYLESFGMNRILPKEEALANHVAEYLEDKGFRVLGNKRRGGIVSFWKEGMDPYVFALRLGKEGICVRAGHHCAQPLHERLGIPGTVRASFYLYNDEEDAERLLEAIG